jgi:hypothetical protein
VDLMADPESRGESGVRAALAAGIDAYESGIRTLTELQWSVARVIDLEPVRTLAVGCADLTRDIGATQVSSARWLLDV